MIIPTHEARRIAPTAVGNGHPNAGYLITCLQQQCGRQPSCAYESRDMRMKRQCIVLLVASQLAAYGQQASQWKEYVYERDGFAVDLPQAPSPHTDPNLPSATVYTIHFSTDSALSIRALPDSRPCTDTLGQLKDGALSGNQPGVDSASVKQISVAGHPALEYSTHTAGQNRYERYICADGGYYIFTAGWPSGEARPAGLDRIVGSLRLLGTGAAPSDFV
jgi:hypothetical protein